ncbi:MAG: hypothetical protein NC310_01260, partial [Roseburia sp.]|nr:hypothetical protein [Roseburia sp.]
KKYECYKRINITPVFISERTPSENREDLWELLNKYDMKSLNKLEWLIRTDMRYSGDRLYVKRRLEIDDNPEIRLNSMFALANRSDGLNKKLLDIICYGGDLYCKEISINDRNRKDYYNLLMPIYIKEYLLKKDKIRNGINRAKNNNSYKGRKQISVDPLLFNKVAHDYLNEIVSLNDALKILNISRSTFFRRLRDFDR